MYAIRSPLLSQSLPAYAAGVDTAEAMLSAWASSFRTATDLAAWWARVWFSAPHVFDAWVTPATTAPAAPATVAEKAIEAVEEIQMAAADVAEATVAAFEEVAEIPLAAAEEAVAVVESEMEPELDDLTQLVGIGPKLATALAERGVTRFEQIAAWGEDELAEIDKSLSLKGRAVRDAWVAQAKRMAGVAPSA